MRDKIVKTSETRAPVTTSYLMLTLVTQASNGKCAEFSINSVG